MTDEEFEEVEDSSLPSVAPDEYVPVGLGGILAATGKALAMNRGLVDQDHRDGIQFKRLMNTADFMAERVRLDAGGLLRKTLSHAARHRSLKGFMPGAFDGWAEGQLISNPLSSPLEEINPLDVHNQNRRVTLMGPGGIGSAEMVTEGMRSVHPSIFGFLSVLEGPESALAGVDTRLSNGVKLGSNGRMYQRFRNPRTGDIHWLSPEDLRGKVIGLPQPPRVDSLSQSHPG